jgi:hypothetical protein
MWYWISACNRVTLRAPLLALKWQQVKHFDASVTSFLTIFKLNLLINNSKRLTEGRHRLNGKH